MRCVVVESPYAADSPEGIQANVDYARACLRDCLKKGESPIASHLLLTQRGVLADGVPAERLLGMEAGWMWIRRADAVVVYTDRGISDGMKRGIKHAEEREIAVEYRKLPT